MGALGEFRSNLVNAIQWLPRGAIAPMQVQPSDVRGDVLVTTANGAEWSADPTASGWRTILFNQNVVGAGAAANKLAFGYLGTSFAVAGTAQAPQPFYWDGSGYAITGYTTQWRVLGHVMTNATGPGVTWICGVQKIGPTGGGAGVIGYGFTGSPIVTSGNIAPGATAVGANGGTPATAGSDGTYALYAEWNGATAANSYTVVTAMLQVRNVRV